MSRGFLIHAYNNEQIDYGSMALCCALLIKKNLKYNNVTLVTTLDTIDWLRKSHDKRFISYAFDNIITTSIYNMSNVIVSDTEYDLWKEYKFADNFLQIDLMTMLYSKAQSTSATMASVLPVSNS